MDLVEESAFDGTMGMGHTLGADHDMICGHEVIGLTGLDERMTFLSEAQILLLVEPLRLDAGNKARIGADGDIDMPGLRTEERRVGKEWVGRVRSWGARY